jgi:hypothetical protein
MLAWHQKVVSLRSQALGCAQPLTDAAQREAAATVKAFGEADGDYGEKLLAAMRQAPITDMSLVGDRVKGFRISLSLNEFPVKGWMWHVSMSGSGSTEARDEILSLLGVPSGVEPIVRVKATHWMWLAPPEDQAVACGRSN